MVDSIIIIGGGIVGASFAYHAKKIKLARSYYSMKLYQEIKSKLQQILGVGSTVMLIMTGNTHR